MATAQISTIEVHKVNKVPFDAPWKWLAAGSRDIMRAPQVSLAYGAFFTALSLLIALALYVSGAMSLVLPLAGGFLLLGPMIAVGLYETSRRLEEGEPVKLADMVRFGVRSPGQLAFMGVFLMIIYFVWMDLAFLLFMLFLGPQAFQLDAIVPTLLFTANGLGLLIVGTLAGAVLALLVFAVTAVSIPLLMRRKVDAVTAAVTSIQAVALNPAPMLLWGILIVAMMAIAFATMFVGMIIIFPLIGHATWHAYRSLIVPLPAKKGKR
ncbi:MAG: DUF2189 domain-containing protein [Hyphomicrobiaceae bacterium]|nr:DUF2189 domain-containing protein [Hyphomicrobiaceae bacterium]